MRRSFGRGGFNNKPQNDKELKINERIFAREVTVIDENNKNLGVMNKFDALNLAMSKDLDLVEVGPKAVPPICKIMNFGSYKYQKEKQERKQKAKQKTTELKTIKVSTRIGEHDLQLRVDQAIKFLGDGNKVRIELQLKGRENQHADLGIEGVKKAIEKIKEKLTDKDLKIEQMVKKLGNKISAIITL